MENPNFFSASILSLQDAQTIKANAWDMAYKNEKNILDVFVSDTLKDIRQISISIIYDDQDNTIQLDKIKSQVDYEVLTETLGAISLKFINLNSGFDHQKSLFELPFLWETPSILISEWSILLSNWENKNLSIWLLNQNSDEYHWF